MTGPHSPACACPECVMLGRLVGRLVESALIDPLEALESELGDVVWDLPGDALDRLIWWRSTQAWCWC